MTGPPTHEEIIDIACVAYFLLGASKNDDMYNSHTARQALTSFCRLTGVNEATLKLKAAGIIP